MSAENITLVFDQKVNLLDGWRVELVESTPPDTNPDPPKPPVQDPAPCDTFVQTFGLLGQSTQNLTFKKYSLTQPRLEASISYTKTCQSSGHQIDYSDKIQYKWFYSLDNTTWKVLSVTEALNTGTLNDKIALRSNWLNTIDSPKVYVQCIAYISHTVASDYSDFLTDGEFTYNGNLPKPRNWPSHATKEIGKLGYGRRDINGAFILNYSVDIESTDVITHKVKCYKTYNPTRQKSYEVKFKIPEPSIFYLSKTLKISSFTLRNRPQIIDYGTSMSMGPDCQIQYFQNHYPYIVNTQHTLGSEFDFDTDFINNFHSSWGTQEDPRRGIYTEYEFRSFSTRQYVYPKMPAKPPYPIPANWRYDRDFPDRYLVNGLQRKSIVPPGFAFAWPAIKVYKSNDGTNFELIFSEGASTGYSTGGWLNGIAFQNNSYSIVHLPYTSNYIARKSYDEWADGFYKIELKHVIPVFFPEKNNQPLQNTQDGAILNYVPWVESNTIRIIDGNTR